MDSDNKSSVLVCVTGQHDCDRLIKVGEKISSSKNMQLHVLCVHPPVEDLSLMSSEIEYLYKTSKDLGGDMTIIFNDDAPQTAADFAEKINAKQLVTGMPDGRLNSFILVFHETAPHIPIAMVSKDNITYNMQPSTIYV